MNKINKAKDNVVNRFTQLMSELFSSDLFSEIKVIDESISKKTIELSNLRESYRGLEIDYINLKSAFSNLQTEMSNYEKSLSDREKNVSEREFAINEKVRIAESKVLNLVKSRESIINEIEAIAVELQNLHSLKDDKEFLLSEIANLKSELAKNNERLESVKTEYSETISSIRKARLESEKELNAIKIQKERELQMVIPTIASLNAREKLLNEKESGLAVIEARWKKLYADKGVGFKV